MNKADYQMVSMICNILGIVLSVIGLFVGIMLSSRQPLGLDATEFFSYYSHSSLLVLGGIILTVVGYSFHWRAQQER